jgi:hypothetical protein
MSTKKESRVKEQKRAVGNGPFFGALGGNQLDSVHDELLSLGLGFGVGFCFSGVFDVNAGRGHLVLNRNL